MPFTRLIALAACLLAGGPVDAAGVKVRFDPSRPEIGPFPTDFLTAPATNTLTGRRVRMPLPDCASNASACRELELVNELDGFNVQPRIRVRFTAAVNPETLKDGLYFVALDDTTGAAGLHSPGDVVRVNQVIYDPATNSAFAKPDSAMDQHRRYALVVSASVKDTAGDAVERDDAFSACIANRPDDYCRVLGETIEALAGLSETPIAGASLFTTLSATSWLERARKQLDNYPPDVRRTGNQSVLALADIADAVWRQNTRLSPPQFTEQPFPFLNQLRGVGRVAFGSYRSPNYLTRTQTIAFTPSGVDPAAPASTSEIFFHAFLPASEKPAAGYPVVIFGHGIGDSRFGGPSAAASVFAARGLATIAINAVGHGYGPNSQIVITTRTGTRIEIPAPGRAVDPTGLAALSSETGCFIATPVPLGLRDCARQTAVDLLQLARAIRAGIDLDGDGAADLDPAKVYYAGQSLGTLYGAMFLAVEPGITQAALNSGGGPAVDTFRWSPNPESRVALIGLLALRQPPLLNRLFNYEENYVLRDQPVKVNDVNGAIAIQDFFETIEWIHAPGDPLSYASHLKSALLEGASEKQVLWLYPWGDRTVPNPTQTALVRHAGMRESAWIYRHDIAKEFLPDLGNNPHSYLAWTLIEPSGLPVAVATQLQIATFFTTGAIPDPNGLFEQAFPKKLFEQPEKLPEGLNFIE